MRIGGREVGPPTEQWYAADPTRWRTAQESGARPRRGTPVLMQFELAYLNGRMRVYDAGRDVVSIWPKERVLAARARACSAAIRRTTCGRCSPQAMCATTAS